eukprot:242381-Chlamydomonas_euryale.AAC.3
MCVYIVTAGASCNPPSLSLIPCCINVSVSHSMLHSMLHQRCIKERPGALLSTLTSDIRLALLAAFKEEHAVCLAYGAWRLLWRRVRCGCGCSGAECVGGCGYCRGACVVVAEQQRRVVVGTEDPLRMPPKCIRAVASCVSP